MRLGRGSMLRFIGRRHDRMGLHLNEVRNCEFLWRPNTRGLFFKELPLLKPIYGVCRFVRFS